MLYADLLAAVAAYTKRSDTAALVPTWIALAEAKLSRELRHFRGLTRTTIVVSSEYQTAPADLIAIRSARLIDSPYWQLDQITPEQLSDLRAQLPSGTLNAICLRGGELAFSPIPSSASNVELTYYAAVPALSATTTSNWVLANFPDLYVWGALAESANFYEDDEQLSKYSSLFADVLKGVNLASVKAEAGFNLSPTPSVQAF